MHPDITKFNDSLGAQEWEICTLLAREIDQALPEAENKIGHGHPVWFLDGNPVVGYSKLKGSVRLLFWSGQLMQPSRSCIIPVSPVTWRWWARSVWPRLRRPW